VCSKPFGEKSLDDVSAAEVRALVSKNVAERQYRDFKAEFDHKLPDAKPKLLRHVASFANGGTRSASGGPRDGPESTREGRRPLGCFQYEVDSWRIRATASRLPQRGPSAWTLCNWSGLRR